METMIRSTLGFAREEANPEPRRDLDLVALLRTMCEDAPDVELGVEPPGAETLPFGGQPVALRRGFGNLIDNAVKYGRRARVCLAIGADGIAVTIDDDGPGLPDDELAVYSGEYRRHGFQGGLNWYRSRSGGAFESELQLFSRRTIDVPSIFISGKSDWGVYQRPGAVERMHDTACTRFVGCHLLDGAGHWVQQEQAGRVSELLLGFLKEHAA